MVVFFFGFVKTRKFGTHLAFAARSRVLAKLVLLAQIGELARRLGHIPLFVFLVFWHPCQVSSQLYRVQRRLKGHLRPLLACFTLPTLPGFYFTACSFQ